jgi:hypothetical protein
MLLGGLLLMAQAASAQIWTHVASACVPDESNTGQYQFTGGSVMFGQNAPTDNATIVVRYNVADPIDFTAAGSPAPWNTLRMGSQIPGAGYTATARLMAVNKVTGIAALVAAVNGGAGVPVSWVAIPAPFNYLLNAYYVEITLTRNGPLTPAVWFVQID